MRILLRDVILDTGIYPRLKHNSETINNYAEALDKGDIFPPIILERGTNRLLDGFHRLKAHVLVNRSEIDVEFHEIPAEVDPLLYAANLNATHGDRLTDLDKKNLARKFLQDNPSMNVRTICDFLHIKQSTAYRWASDILAKRKESQRHEIFKLSMLGWTQTNISKKLDISQPTVSQELSNFLSWEKSIIDQHAVGLHCAQIAQRFGCGEQLIKAVINRAAPNDCKRLANLDMMLQVHETDDGYLLSGFWNDVTLEQAYIYSLFYLTKPGDIIYGVDADLCLLMSRRTTEDPQKANFVFSTDPSHIPKPNNNHLVIFYGPQDMIKAGRYDEILNIKEKDWRICNELGFSLPMDTPGLSSETDESGWKTWFTYRKILVFMPQE